MTTNDALLAGLRQAAELIDVAQAILADHVRPDGLTLRKHFSSFWNYWLMR